MSHIPKPFGTRIPTKPKSGTVLATKENQAKEPQKKNLPKSTYESINVPKLATALKRNAPISKPTTDINKRPMLAANKPGISAPAVTRKPTKRLVGPANEIKPKVSKPNPTKPAPYDYKSRFNLLKEQYDNLKSIFATNKEKLNVITNENEELTAANEKLTSDLQTNTDELLILRPKNVELDAENKVLKTQLQQCRTEIDCIKENLTAQVNENDQIKITLIEYTSRIEQLTDTNKSLMEEVDKCKLRIIDLKEELDKLDFNRRTLLNEIQDLKGNIRVFCRIRPYLLEEKHKLLCNINYIDEKSLEITKSKESIESKGRPNVTRFDFTFDRVFTPHSSQNDIFSELAQLVRSALDGYNVCVFAYGQTGSGKTYTMDGGYSDETAGMIPRAVELIFKSFEQLQKIDWTYTVKVSFLEIYNETIIDLLSTKKNQHEIRMTNTKGTDVYVTNLTVETVSSVEELNYHIRIARRNRSVAATENNERSSRSHSVTKILFEGVKIGKNEKCAGSVNLIDLAGSERLSNNSTPRLKETQNINKSLANLSNVILALVQKQEHVPYRNSKLTHLLMPCLGGNSKTLMLVNIAPFEDCYSETINSLRFASIVNQCKTGIVTKNRTLLHNQS